MKMIITAEMLELLLLYKHCPPLPVNGKDTVIDSTHPGSLLIQGVQEFWLGPAHLGCQIGAL